MPKQQDEESLATVFADVHYYFSPPTSRPVHDRFDKASYLYLYQTSAQKRLRIEVANNAGTKEQDAFSGSLDNIMLQYSHKHPTLVTLTVDGAPQDMSALPPPRQSDGQQWHIAAFDLRKEAKYFYKIHSIDIYFYTADDASLFIDFTQKSLSQSQLRILDAKPMPSSQKDVVSPVVQKLEQAVITPSPGSHVSAANPGHNASFAPPPVELSSGDDVAPSPKPEEPSNFAPIAYNPVAPAAPEPIKHREKTPPPPDDGTGTGLSSAAMGDPHQLSYGQPQAHYQNALPPPPPSQPQPGHYGAAPPQHQAYPPAPPPPASQTSPVPGHPYSTPPGSQPFSSVPGGGIPLRSHSIISSQGSIPQRTASFAQPNINPNSPHQYGQPLASPPLMQTHGSIPSAVGHAASPQQSYQQQMGTPPPGSGHPQHVQQQQPHQQQQQQHQQQQYGQQPSQQQYVNYAQSPGFSPAQAQPLSQPPMGGYSDYQYGQSQQQQQQQHGQPVDPYAYHNQVYRPTEAEAAAHAPKPPKPGQEGRLDARVQKGVGKFLKKLEKKVG
ncbi:MAG: hypothetical protein M1825_005208 [Sarcosagium campestre]|nr:MAG: hypothetical protein M1825_005208 [Sarcosagium campestre]